MSREQIDALAFALGLLCIIGILAIVGLNR